MTTAGDADAERVALLDTIDATTDALCTVSAEVTAECASGGPDNVIQYDATIRYQPTDRVAELYAVNAYLNTYHDEALAQEPLTDAIAADFAAALAPEYVTVELDATHAPGVSLTTTTTVSGDNNDH